MLLVQTPTGGGPAVHLQDLRHTLLHTLEQTQRDLDVIERDFPLQSATTSDALQAVANRLLEIGEYLTWDAQVLGGRCECSEADGDDEPGGEARSLADRFGLKTAAQLEDLRRETSARREPAEAQA